MSTSQKSFPSQIALALALVLATCVAYRGVLDNGFVNFDDDLYVTANPHVRAGLSLDGVRWAFTTGHSANWHPLTWLSHMLDVELFGLNAAAHHAVNVLLHGASAALLFVFLTRFGGHMWRAFFVAALFALHPLRVESVAWVAERKDVLAGLFWMLCLLAYGAYAQRGGIGRYLCVIVTLALGLMAKPMLVTLPCVLLLLDFWPLRRLSVRAVVEKVPLFLLVIASSIATAIVQAEGGAVTTDRIPLVGRLANAASSYVTYAWKSFVPTDLSAFYPHPALDPGASGGGWGSMAWVGLASVLVLSGACLRQARRAPWAVTGWFWYLGTLVPVIGILQVGEQAWADRYSYLTTIGLTLCVVYAAGELVSNRPALRRVAPFVGAGVLAVLGVATHAQVGSWRDSQTLWRRALDVTERNVLAHGNLASALAEAGQLEEAEEHYRKALAINPRAPRANTGLGYVLHLRGRDDEALGFLFRADKLDPGYPETSNNIGLVYAARGQVDLAEDRFLRVLAANPAHAHALSNLGAVYLAQRRSEEAIARLLEALSLQPELVSARNNLGIAYARSGRLEEAQGEFQRVLQIEPENGIAHAELGMMAFARRELAPAALHLTAALEVSFDLDVARALAQLRASSPDATLRDGAAALRLVQAARDGGAGTDPRLLWIEAAAHAASGDFAAAAQVQERAIDRAPPSMRSFEEERLASYRQGRPWVDGEWR